MQQSFQEYKQPRPAGLHEGSRRHTVTQRTRGVNQRTVARPITREKEDLSHLRPRDRKEAQRRRGWAAVAVLGAAVVAFLGGTRLMDNIGEPDRLPPASTKLLEYSEEEGRWVYTVRPNDTLSAIAERLDPNEDPRPLADQLAEQLPDGRSLNDIRFGEQIPIPEDIAPPPPEGIDG